VLKSTPSTRLTVPTRNPNKRASNDGYVFMLLSLDPVPVPLEFCRESGTFIFYLFLLALDCREVSVPGDLLEAAEENGTVVVANVVGSHCNGRQQVGRGEGSQADRL
jgi:hypothetical protein